MTNQPDNSEQPTLMPQEDVMPGEGGAAPAIEPTQTVTSPTPKPDPSPTPDPDPAPSGIIGVKQADAARTFTTPKRKKFNSRRRLVNVLSAGAAAGSLLVPLLGSHITQPKPKVAPAPVAPVAPSKPTGPATFGTAMVADSTKFTTGTFEDCPSTGEGANGDSALDSRKNRDKPNAVSLPIAIHQLVQLHLPVIESQGRADRDKWTVEAKKAAAPYENSFVTIEGYMQQARDEGPESCNCGATAGIDTHTWLTEQPHGNRATDSAVAEVSPRLKASHPNWTESGFKPLISKQVKLRITGWVMYDQEHGDQVRKSRGTVWEVHPIHKIEVQGPDGKWAPF